MPCSLLRASQEEYSTCCEARQKSTGIAGPVQHLPLPLTRLEAWSKPLEGLWAKSLNGYEIHLPIMPQLTSLLEQQHVLDGILRLEWLWPSTFTMANALG